MQSWLATNPISRHVQIFLEAWLPRNSRIPACCSCNRRSLGSADRYTPSSDIYHPPPIAYHLLHSIEYTLRMKADRSRWITIKRLVSTHGYSTIQLPTTNGTIINLRKSSVPEGVHQELYKKLAVDLSQLPITRNLA